ncbi:MAG: hypothetical protein QGG01_05575, partial [Roseibacillus sp.]|nr:hypothetical protein [Roseibacillus sp.]
MKRSTVSPAGSPGLKPALKKQQGLEMHEMSPIHPPALHGPAEGDSPEVTIPPDGSTTDQLRDFIATKFTILEDRLKDFEAGQLEKFHQLDNTDANLFAGLRALDPLVPHAQDVGVFARVKTLVTQEAFQTKIAEVEKVIDALNDTQPLEQVKTEIILMKERINGFVCKVETVEG